VRTLIITLTLLLTACADDAGHAPTGPVEVCRLAAPYPLCECHGVDGVEVECPDGVEEACLTFVTFECAEWAP